MSASIRNHWLSDSFCLDLWGLSSREAARARRNRQFHPGFIHTLTKNNQVKIAILYEHWFADFGGLPPEWTKVAQWQITNNVVCVGDTVTFYAVDPREKDKLISRLEKFAPRLPPDVTYRLIQ